MCAVVQGRADEVDPGQWQVDWREEDAFGSLLRDACHYLRSCRWMVRKGEDA